MSPAPRAARLARAWAVALAAVFLTAHLAFLPPTLEDLDSMNFALGLRDFDPATHQPHPPGYPVFIALGKLAHTVLGSEAASLAVWGAVFGALAVFPLMTLFRCVEALDPVDRHDEAATQRPALATLVVAVSPVFWFTALRPLSDVPGFTAALVAQACLATAFMRQRLTQNDGPAALAASGRATVLGALAAGLALGFRTQTVWLTVPLLALVLMDRVGRGAAGALLGSLMTFSLGVLAWGVPLVIASGGLSRYRAALTAQSAEQFTGLDILLSNPTARRLALGLLEALVRPWALSPLGFIVVALAFVGFVVLLRQAPAGALLLAAATVPYGVFHLIVQETYSRYALPFVPAVGYLAVRGAWVLGRRPATWACGAIALTSLLVTLPAARSYASHPSPAFEAMRQVELQTGGREAALAMHQTFARVAETEAPALRGLRILKAPPMRERSELVNYWREGNVAPVWFLADPPRTDLELIDPASRAARGHYGWEFPRLEFMNGVRPDIVDLIHIDSPPGWFCEDGWHLTPETLGQSELVPRRESVAYIRNRQEPALLVIGGESLETSGAISFSAAVNDRIVDQWVLPAKGTFFRRTLLAPGALAGDSMFSRLVVSYRAADESARNIRVRLTQFAAQSSADTFFVQHAGWWEIEYNVQLQRRWRWTSDRAVTLINSAGRDVVVTAAGESPLRYFDSAPHVIVRAGEHVLATAEPTGDFELEVKVPAQALRDSDGMLTIETDKTFVPGDRSRSPDRRHLGLRIFKFEVR